MGLVCLIQQVDTEEYGSVTTAKPLTLCMEMGGSVNVRNERRIGCGPFCLLSSARHILRLALDKLIGACPAAAVTLGLSAAVTTSPAFSGVLRWARFQ